MSSSYSSMFSMASVLSWEMSPASAGSVGFGMRPPSFSPGFPSPKSWQPLVTFSFREQLSKVHYLGDIPALRFTAWLCCQAFQVLTARFWYLLRPRARSFSISSSAETPRIGDSLCAHSTMYFQRDVIFSLTAACFAS